MKNTRSAKALLATPLALFVLLSAMLTGCGGGDTPYITESPPPEFSAPTPGTAASILNPEPTNSLYATTRAGITSAVTTPTTVATTAPVSGSPLPMPVLSMPTPRATPANSQTTPAVGVTASAGTAPAATGSATTAPTTQGNSVHYRPVNFDEVIGVWISYIELGSVLTRKSESQFRESYGEMMDNCRSLGINTVYVHLRPFGDALYRSDYYPWSKYVTGTVGRAPDFDPLAVMLEETHRRGLSFHGWLNPMRIQSDSDISRVSTDYAIGEWYADDSKRGKYIVKHGSNWYLNPAYEEVRELIGKGAEEITARYNVDALHIDDYFYPTTDAAFDSEAFRASPFTDLSRFRFTNVNAMVRRMYVATKAGNPNALFGISPQASISNNYNQLYADVESWCRNAGYADYIVPQAYYGFNNQAQPFAECIAQWQELVSGTHIKLIFGLAAYKIGVEDSWAGTGSREWLEERQILRRQITEARRLAGYGGVVFFSYNYLFNPVHVTAAHRDEIEAFRALLQ